MKESDIQAAMDSAASIAVDKPGLSYGTLRPGCASVDDIERWGSAPGAILGQSAGLNNGCLAQQGISQAIAAQGLSAANQSPNALTNTEVELSALRVTPATQPFTMPVTGGSNWGPYCRAVSEAITDKMMKENPFLRGLHPAFPVEGTDKPEPERRPDGTLKPAAKAWGAPRQASDPRRVGG